MLRILILLMCLRVILLDLWPALLLSRRQDTSDTIRAQHLTYTDDVH